MKYICTVKNSEQKQDILAHLEGGLGRIEKIERRKCKVIASIGSQRHLTEVELILRGSRVEFSARASADNPFQAIDLAVMKICKQLSKKRGRILSKRNKELPIGQRQAPSPWEFDTLRGAIALPSRKKAS